MKTSTGVSENNVGDCSNASVKIWLNHHIYIPTTRSVYSNTGHSDDHCRYDGDEACNSQIADFLQRPW